MNKTSPSSNSKSSSFDQEKYLYLTTRGRKSGQLREIEIWFTHYEGCFYVIAEYPTSNWVQNLRVNPAVEVRALGKSFSAQASVLQSETDADLIKTIQQLSEKKYSWGDGQVVQLKPNANP